MKGRAGSRHVFSLIVSFSVLAAAAAASMSALAAEPRGASPTSVTLCHPQSHTQGIGAAGQQASAGQITISGDADFDAQFPGRRIEGLAISGSGLGYCIRVLDCSAPFLIANCTLSSASAASGDVGGIILGNCSAGTIRGCALESNEGFGILLRDCSGLTVDGCTITQGAYPNNGAGMGLLRTFGSLVQRCDINRQYQSGISLDYSAGNTMRNNSLSSNGVGMTVCDMSDRNNITGNLFFENVDYAAMVLCIDQESRYNRFWDNNFINNHGSGTSYSASARQAQDIGGKNFWNLTGGCGNYWEDWTAPDANSDGYVDQPYVLDGNLPRDMRPLVGPLEVAEPSSTAPAFLPAAAGAIAAAFAFHASKRKRSEAGDE